MFMKKGGEGRPEGAMPTVKKIAGCIRVFAKWLFIGSVVGILVGTVSALFGRALGFANAFRAAHPRMLLALPAAGLVIAFLYRSFLHSGDRGTNLVIASIHSSADIPFRTAPLIFVSTVLTQLCGGSAGREGAAFGCAAASLLGLPAELVAACGMVGLFCGVTNCPISSLMIAFELFGFEGMPYYLTTVAVSYLFSGYYGLYRDQKIMYSKTETHFINTTAH